MIRRAARRHGFLDPIALMSRMQSFAQPSEVTEPIELLRAGAILHARGLVNTRAIQHNMDWVWPYWVEQQFNPHSPSFVPRAFSMTHVNLTHRNWTAVGLPDMDDLAVVDPCGLVMPFWDSWSLDGWIVPDEGDPLLPSRCQHTTQHLQLEPNLVVVTQTTAEGMKLVSRTSMQRQGGRSYVQTELRGESDKPAWLVLAVRPVNPEGVSFIERIDRVRPDELVINQMHQLLTDPQPDRLAMSRYADGDVLTRLPSETDQEEVKCRVGMATAAAMYRLDAGHSLHIVGQVPMETVAGRSISKLEGEPRRSVDAPGDQLDERIIWEEATEGMCRMQVPDEKVQFLYDAACRTLVLHSATEVYAGPYTYKRFWFRDAVIILDALLALGLADRVARAIARFPADQTVAGYFRSQTGEWDSNGQVLWLLDRFEQRTGRDLDPKLMDAAVKAVKWIDRKRVPETKDRLEAGLLPAGFSAEHLGPNDFYYWDDFWSIGGLQSAARLLSDHDPTTAGLAERVADQMEQAVERSLSRSADRRDRPGIPASPYRRMDSGAIGSLAVGYPLELWPADEPRLLDTAEFLLENCMVHDGFFQDVIHSGINPYMTLHIAQVLLRAGDLRFGKLVDAVAALPSPTGQWPEAVHPNTGGGCMGDGQHVWAASEWLLFWRNAFVHESPEGLTLGRGLPAEWLNSGQRLRFGPTPTRFGPVSVSINTAAEPTEITCTGDWFDQPPRIDIHLADHRPLQLPTGQTTVQLAESNHAKAHEESSA
jgi:hypothetical protein